jgi:hypothetical protein
MVVMHAKVMWLGIFLAATTVWAEAPPAPMDANAILRASKAALEPPRPSRRDLEIVLRDAHGAETRWTARQAMQPRPDGGRVVMVMTGPTEVAGAAFLIGEQPGNPDVQWEYLPSVRRVRKLVPIGAFHPLLGSDFNYGDIGFLDLNLQSVKLLGEETQPNGARVYRIEERPKNQWYYSKIIDVIAKDTMLPLRREYYTPAGELWKVELFEAITPIQGIPTPLVIRMEDKLEGGSTELRADHVRYDVDIPADVFEPVGLPHLLDHKFWRQNG